MESDQEGAGSEEEEEWIYPERRGGREGVIGGREGVGEEGVENMEGGGDEVKCIKFLYVCFCSQQENEEGKG